MLYRTPPHHTYFSQFPSAAISSLSFLCPLPSSSFSSSSSSLQVQREMECVEAALKSSIRKEMALKSMIPQAILEDLCAVNVQNGTPCDDFSVDELLDFSNEQGLVEEEEDEEEDGEGEKICTTTVSVAPKPEKACQDEDKDSEQQRCTNFSAKDDFVYVPAGELGVPADDLASLEWLSHFVEDSNSEYSAPFPAGIFPEKPKMEAQSSEPERPVSTEPCFKTPVPAKARSKRTRTGVKVWPFGSPSITESSSSSVTSSSSSSSPSSPWLICTNPGMTPEPAEPVCVEKPLAKKQKKKPALEAGASGGGGAQQPRRCSHCGVQKTPQWRAGPLGAKTLCNACGVRFKSGRLLPEYRPACSPTFSSELHSNHHRKVLEMRRKKEVLGQAEPVLAPPVISSFC